MPIIYLSPSTAEQQPVITGGSEEYYMNLVADAMVPYLRVNNIEFERNDPGMTVAQIIDASNAKYHDMHLALDMEAGVGNLAGLIRGLKVLHYTGSPGGSQAAATIGKNLKTVYPDPNLVTVSSDRLDRELRDTDAVAIEVDLGYRDNLIDVTWLQNNINNVARNIVMSLTEYFGTSFVDLPPASTAAAYPYRHVMRLFYG